MYGFADAEGPIIEWVHGPEHLPPKCPFCKLPPSIKNAETATPTIVCEIGFCPINGKVFSLEHWNLCRPEAWEFQRLLDRWKKLPALRNPVRALARAVRKHQQGRW